MIEDVDSSTNEEPQTLKTGNYVVEFSNGPSVVYRTAAEGGSKEWVCTCPDPESAMLVIEGLILVENKRFYYPDATPKVNFQELNEV